MTARLRLWIWDGVKGMGRLFYYYLIYLDGKGTRRQPGKSYTILHLGRREPLKSAWHE
jgi:hypothetical protein